ncbi:hypothetical protein KL86PLE_20199 [uncultured Pleomorphomonas sp.]|uniref:Uncharacterized protein n=1 Tax=uncultured Pleomorphomonas sp. TaxID=442121 RepID=A0A212LDA7_9HYPH|nr:hypothetical protein KL86PLE_20199 [uncultured Pleomorphomonas sp.]
MPAFRRPASEIGPAGPLLALISAGYRPMRREVRRVGRVKFAYLAVPARAIRGGGRGGRLWRPAERAAVSSS